MEKVQVDPKRVEWARKEALADIRYGRACSKIKPFRARHDLPDDAVTQRLWNEYCQVKCKAGQQRGLSVRAVSGRASERWQEVALVSGKRKPLAGLRAGRSMERTLIAWARVQAHEDVRNGTACRKLTQFQVKYNIPDAAVARPLWQRYCQVRDRDRDMRRFAGVPVMDLMGTGLVPVKRFTQRHTIRLRGRPD